MRAPKRLLALRGDDVLVERVRAGDPTAFEVLYERHVPGLLSFCRHMLGDAGEAEDAVQQAFAAAHADILRSPREINFKPWLYTIARNRCVSVLRVRRDEPDPDPEVSTEGLSEQVQQRADLREMVADINDLPQDQRAALVLSELGDLSQAEVAEVLGCGVSNVKGLVFRARAGLSERRDARAAPCEEIRAELASARRGGLRRGRLRHHLKACPGCAAYLEDVRRQRRMLAVVLPVIPSAGLKETVLAATGIGGGGAAAGGAAAGGGTRPVRLGLDRGQARGGGRADRGGRRGRPAGGRASDGGRGRQPAGGRAGGREARGQARRRPSRRPARPQRPSLVERRRPGAPAECGAGARARRAPRRRDAHARRRRRGCRRRTERPGRPRRAASRRQAPRRVAAGWSRPASCGASSRRPRAKGKAETLDRAPPSPSDAGPGSHGAHARRGPGRLGGGRLPGRATASITVGAVRLALRPRRQAHHRLVAAWPRYRATISTACPRSALGARRRPSRPSPTPTA